MSNQQFPVAESSPILVDLLNQIRRMENERVDLLQVIASLRAERDEARREVCMWQSISPQHDTNGIFDIADQRGWDCYKKQNEALDRIAQFDQENGLL